MINCNICDGFIYELGEFRDDNECTCSIDNEKSHLKNEIKRLKAKLKHVESHRDAHFKMSRQWYKQLRYTIDVIKKLENNEEPMDNSNEPVKVEVLMPKYIVIHIDGFCWACKDKQDVETILRIYKNVQIFPVKQTIINSLQELDEYEEKLKLVGGQ